MRIPIKTTIGVLAAVGASMALPGLAGAASSTVTATTHDGQHSDTTSVSSPCTGTSDNGPTWATDNLSFKFIVTPYTTPQADGANYSVTINSNGSFVATSDPTTGACAAFSGTVNGTIQYDVSSTSAPDPKNLPAQSPNTPMGHMLSTLFGTKTDVRVGGGSYSYSYGSLHFGATPYTQVG